MKLKLSILILLLTIIAFLSGCASNQMQTPVQQSLIITPSVSPPKEIFTSTATAVPTLYPENTEKFIEEQFMKGSDCAAPCFMDVIPGQTTFDEAKAMFGLMSIDLQYTTSVGDNEFYSFIYRFQSGLELSPIFTIQDNVIKNIKVGVVPSFQDKSLNNELQIYSPKFLINQYGQPSRTEFVLDWGPRNFFDMIIYFDSFDLVIEYTGYNIIEGSRDKPNVCVLAVRYDSLRAWLGKKPTSLPDDGIPLSEATQLSTEEFSNILLGKSENACITFNGKVFQ